MSAVWWFDDDPDEDDYRLFTDKDAETALGIKASTIRCWKRRNKLHPDGLDNLGREVFYKHRLLTLAASTRKNTRHSVG